MAKFHITPEGPKPCKVDPANPRSRGCDYGEHYSSLEEAEKSYSDKLAVEHGPHSTLEPSPYSSEPLEYQSALQKIDKLYEEGEIEAIEGYSAISKTLDQEPASSEELADSTYRLLSGGEGPKTVRELEIDSATLGLPVPYEEAQRLLTREKLMQRAFYRFRAEHYRDYYVDLKNSRPEKFEEVLEITRANVNSGVNGLSEVGFLEVLDSI